MWPQWPTRGLASVHATARPVQVFSASSLDGLLAWVNRGPQRTPDSRTREVKMGSRPEGSILRADLESCGCSCAAGASSHNEFQAHLSWSLRPTPFPPSSGHSHPLWPVHNEACSYLQPPNDPHYSARGPSLRMHSFAKETPPAESVKFQFSSPFFTRAQKHGDEAPGAAQNEGPFLFIHTFPFILKKKKCFSTQGGF